MAIALPWLQLSYGLVSAITLSQILPWFSFGSAMALVSAMAWAQLWFQLSYGYTQLWLQLNYDFGSALLLTQI